MSVSEEELKIIESWWLEKGHNLSHHDAVIEAFSLGLKTAKMSTQENSEAP